MKNLKKLLALVLALVMCLSVLAACGPTDPTDPVEEDPTDPPVVDGYKEAPYITKLGTYGKVEDRLPKEEDIMVENADYLQIGVYGGELLRAAGSGNWGAGKPIEEGLFRFKTDGTVEPNVAKGYEVNADCTVYTIYLREGMKWSDGHPFTAEDCVWFYNVICKYKIDDKGIRNCHKDANGNPAVVEKVNDTTFTVTFGTPKYDFLEALSVDLKWHYAPKHIFETYANYVVKSKEEGISDADKAYWEAKALTEAEKICGGTWTKTKDAGKQMLYYFWNWPGIPTLNPYVLSTEAGKNNIKGEYYEFVRNPYYWKVDAAKQQLPYIDKIVYQTVQNADQSYMMLLDGSIDFEAVAPANVYHLTTAANVKFNIYKWSNTSWGDTGTQLHFNLGIADAKLNGLFNNKAFREAVSICVNREEFAELYSEGWLQGGQAAPQKGAQGYNEEWATKWTEYDVNKAKTLLESCGLVMGADNYYDFADGTDFILNISSVAESGAADTYKLLKPYFDAAGINTSFRDYERSVVDENLKTNAVECMLAPVTGIGDISIALKPNSMIPDGQVTNVAWYGRLSADTVTGDLKKLVDLKKQLDKTGDTAERERLCLEMLKLHQDNMWTIAYVQAQPTVVAVNARIHNFLADGIFSDIYRDWGIAHCQCWYIPVDQQ